MVNKFRLVSIVLVATLIGVVCFSISAPKANAAVYKVALRARHQDLLCVDIGTIVIDYTPYALPATAMLADSGLQHQIEFPAPYGCEFVTWEVEGSVVVRDPKSPKSLLTVAGDGLLRVVYRGTCCRAVGGVVTPTNTYMALAPYLVLAGLITAGAAVCIKKRYD